MKKRSNLDMMGAVMLMFCWREEGKIERKKMEVRGRRRTGGGKRIEPKDKEEMRGMKSQRRSYALTLYHVILCYSVLP